MTNTQRRFSLLLCAGMLLASAAGCSSGQPSGPSSSAAAPSAAASAVDSSSAGTAETEEKTAVTFPIQDEITMTWWSNIDKKVAAFAEDNGAVAAYRLLQEKTGVKLNFIHPPTGQEGEQFNLMIASNELPDIIYYKWGTIGAQKYIDDGIILNISDAILAQDSNFKKNVLDQRPEIAREIQTDNGSYYMYPFLRADPVVRNYKGLQIRKDWLDALGLSIPQNRDDWYMVLKAFKENNPGGSSENIPFISKKMDALEILISSFGVTTGYMLDDEMKTLMSGCIQPQYKDALAYLNKLYTEGLIYSDYMTCNDKVMDAKISAESTGAWNGAITGALAKYMDVLTKTNPKAEIAGVPYLQGDDGKRYTFGNQLILASGGNGAAISTKCKYPEIAAAMLDFNYGEEGHMIFNFGEEGVSYTMEDGYPQYTDLILKNPDGLSIGDALARYTVSITDGPILQDARYFEQMFIYPQQKDAVEQWGKDIYTNRTIPNVTLTSEEQKEISVIEGDCNTYRDEMVAKFIMGTEPLDKFDDFVAEMKNRGIEKAVEIRQAAYDRYQNRKLAN